MSRFRLDPFRVHAIWHIEQCTDCAKEYEELSDPRASLHLCHDCIVKRQGRLPDDAPLQKDQSKFDWWDAWCLACDYHESVGDLQTWLNTKESE